MSDSKPTESTEQTFFKAQLPVPSNLYVGRAVFDLLNKQFSKDYISGNSMLPNEAKRRNRKITYILIAIFIILLVALIVLSNYVEI